jgi:hypothetical protein
MVLRDTLVYKASMRNFQVVSVARPRQPVLVGSCVLPDESGGMSLRDTLAFVPNAPTQVVNVADPANPVVVAQIGRYAWNVFVKDTLAFFAGGNGLFTYSVADIYSPYLIDSTAWGANVFDVVVVDTLAYVGCRDGLRLLSVADPVEPHLLAFQPTAYLVWRLAYAEPHVYAACSEAGICIFETTQTGIAEPDGRPCWQREAIRLVPNPAGRSVLMDFGGRPATRPAIAVLDAAGRQVTAAAEVSLGDDGERLDLSRLAPGVYFVRLQKGSHASVAKLVKR